ncbi:hypothetical protein TL18_03815 [Methanobrevibacter sp. YE315]|uniref:hypothetical protein n=1 Tax=Methanobrevibacter sp. YE315 TaxID=1609968 RepID=UPI000764E61F|nr:hypothetical protein [Methanobrevibacter sp. YE315]AMD18436.1 hypothetical protein TL18_03815 [Methanobrevibacter sp. YE315]
MKTGKMILTAIILIIIALLLFTITSPILIIAEDTDEGDPGIDMAASFTPLGGFDWVYPGNSVNEYGQTLHNIHLDSPDNPYGAARDIMTYTYHYTPHLIVSVNNEAAESIFGTNIVDNIRANDAYNGYPGNENAQGTMSRGDAVGTAMANSEINAFEIPLQVLMGNIKFHIV